MDNSVNKSQWTAEDYRRAASVHETADHIVEKLVAPDKLAEARGETAGQDPDGDCLLLYVERQLRAIIEATLQAKEQEHSRIMEAWAKQSDADHQVELAQARQQAVADTREEDCNAVCSYCADGRNFSRGEYQGRVYYNHRVSGEIIECPASAINVLRSLTPLPTLTKPLSFCQCETDFTDGTPYCQECGLERSLTPPPALTSVQTCNHGKTPDEHCEQCAIDAVSEVAPPALTKEK